MLEIEFIDILNGNHLIRINASNIGERIVEDGGWFMLYENFSVLKGKVNKDFVISVMYKMEEVHA